MTRKASAFGRKGSISKERRVRRASIPRDVKYELKRMIQKEQEITEKLQTLRVPTEPTQSQALPVVPTPNVKLVPIGPGGRSPSKSPRKRGKPQLPEKLRHTVPNQSPNEARRWGTLRQTKETSSSPLCGPPQVSPSKHRRRAEPTDEESAQMLEAGSPRAIPDSVGWALESHPQDRADRKKGTRSKKATPKKRGRSTMKAKGPSKAELLIKMLMPKLRQTRPEFGAITIGSDDEVDSIYAHISEMLEQSKAGAAGPTLAGLEAWHARLLGDCAVHKAKIRHRDSDAVGAWVYARKAATCYKSYIQSKFFHALNRSVEYSVQEKKDNTDRLMTILQLTNEVFEPFVTNRLTVAQQHQAEMLYKQASDFSGVIIDSFVEMESFFKDRSILAHVSSVFVKSQLKLRRTVMSNNAQLLAEATVMRQWSKQAVTAECNGSMVAATAATEAKSLSVRASKAATRAASRAAAKVSAQAVYEMLLVQSVAEAEASFLYCLTQARSTVVETNLFLEACLAMRMEKAAKLAQLTNLYAEKLACLAAGMTVAAGARIYAANCAYVANNRVAAARARASFISATQAAMAATKSAGECVQAIMAPKHVSAIKAKGEGQYTLALHYLRELSDEAAQMAAPPIWQLRVWLRGALAADRRAVQIASQALTFTNKELAAAEATTAALVCREFAVSHIYAADALCSSLACAALARQRSNDAEAVVVNVMCEHLGRARSFEREEKYGQALHELKCFNSTRAVEIFLAMQDCFFNPPHSPAIERCSAITYSCLANDSCVRDTRALQQWLQTLLDAEANAAAAAAMAVSKAHSIVLPCYLNVIRCVLTSAVAAAWDAADMATDEAMVIEEQYAAAVTIQSCRRVQQSIRRRKHMKACLLSAVMVQAYERGRKARELKSGKKAAKMANIAVRVAFRAVPSCLASLALAEAKVAMAVCRQSAHECCWYAQEQLDTIKLAIRMQTLGRGHNTRSYFKIASALHIAACASRAAWEECDWTTRQAAADVFEAVVLRKEQDKGAVELQALVRGHLYRKFTGSRDAVRTAACAAHMASAACALARAHAYASVEDAKATREEQQAAITKVQAITRGHLGRGQLAARVKAGRRAFAVAMEAAGAAAVARLNADAAVEDAQELQAKATKLQALARGRNGRRAFDRYNANVAAAEIAELAAEAATASGNAAALSAANAEEEATSRATAGAAETETGDASEAAAEGDGPASA